MSKKILSLALAVIMLFSVCAVAANAAVADGATIAIRVETDAKVGTPAGKDVHVTLYLDLPEGEELQMGAGAFTIGWNSAKYKLKTELAEGSTSLYDAREWGDSYASYFKSNANVAVGAAMVKKIVAKFDADATASGWDTGCQIAQAYDTTNASGTAGFPCHSGEAVFTLTFVTLDTITAADTIGYVKDACGETFSALKKWTGVNKTSTIAKADVDLTNAVPAVGAADAPAKAQVYELSAPRKHATGDKYTVAAFFAFDAATIAPDFVKGTSQFIKGITATVTATSGGQSITVTPDEINYVYDINKDGTVYGFRVIMKNVPADAEITIVPAVTTDGTAYTVDTLNFNVADVTAY